MPGIALCSGRRRGDQGERDGAMRRAAATILMYHRVSDARADLEEGDYALPAALFTAQMRLLAQRWPVVALASLREGGHPERAVVLTFDDGCDTDATIAAPLLRSLGLPATFFVNPARVGEEGRASWDQLRALMAQGLTIGSHGLDHALLDELSAGELERQIVGSKRALEQRLGQPVDAFSLPGGSGGARARRTAHDAGYRYVLGSRPGLARRGASSGILPRLAIRRGHGLDGFEAAIGQQPLFLLSEALRYHLKHAARRLLGVPAYSRLRLLVLRGASPARKG